MPLLLADRAFRLVCIVLHTAVKTCILHVCYSVLVVLVGNICDN